MQTFFRTALFVALLFSFIITVSAKSPPTPGASEEDIKNRNAVAFPVWRLQKDWMYQDHGLDVSACFRNESANAVETAMVRKVLAELQTRGLPTEEHESGLKELADVPGNDPRWKEFYFALCHIRRQARLTVFNGHPRQYVYAKHHVFGDSQPMFCATTHQSDAEYRDRGPDYQMGAELCLMTISSDGSVATEVLLNCPNGVVRDPSVSFDGKRIAFSMRKNDVDDDFHLYIMEVADRSVRQITWGEGTVDIEPCYLPNGDIVFSSTRCDQTAPCWWTNVTNLYTCDSEGRYIRRLGFDTDHTIYPQILPDGRIIYTRWEYNDRPSGLVQSAFVMNSDGTNQAEFYGNNSWLPTSHIHMRGIPGTQKVISVITGHHCSQHGRLVMMDRTKGIQYAQGLESICPVEEVVIPDIQQKFYTHPENPIFDLFGYNTPGQSQYPWALDERNFLVSHTPEQVIPSKGQHNRGPYRIKFGIYWMGIAGERELLIYDPTISSGQHVPLATRDIPPQKPTQVDLDKDHGTFYVQDVYYGPGLKGIERGTVKKLRVVGIAARAVAEGTTIWHHPRGANSMTPPSINNGSWDVKHVLGTVDVEEDGSVQFDVPSRLPVYFQLLDEKGHAVQTMRSWTVLQPGETLSCIGCHEDKSTSFTSGNLMTQASRKAPQKIVPFFKKGEEPIQEQLEFFTEDQRRAWDYLTVNAPQGEDVPRGFSYRREVQPIWDRHCISCHTGTKNPAKPSAPLSLLGDSKPYDTAEAFKDVKWTNIAYPYKEQVVGRDFSESYLNLTTYGHKNDWIDFLPIYSPVEMIPPYYFGSAKSNLMNYLEPSHYDVQLTQEEKNNVACWIDLCIPYCGSYMEANTWDSCIGWKRGGRYLDKLRAVYFYHEAKRLAHAMVEVDHLEKYKEHLRTGKLHRPEDFAQMHFGGPKIQRDFIEHFQVQNRSVPIHGKTADNSVRNLALNPYATTHQIRSYPHATSNSHHKYRAENSPKNLIDGDHSQDGSAWCPDPRTDLWVQVDFGREVTVEKTVLYLKMFPGAEKTWTNATLSFSDGSKIPIMLRHTAEAQEFDIPARKTRFVKLEELKETFPLGRNGIVEWEIFGKD